MVEKAPAELEVHKDVDVTVWTCLSAGHGPEHADVAGAMAFRYGQDLVAVGPQEVVDCRSAHSAHLSTALDPIRAAWRSRDFILTQLLTISGDGLAAGSGSEVPLEEDRCFGFADLPTSNSQHDTFDVPRVGV